MTMVRPNQTLLAVIDFQEKLLPAMHDAASLEETAVKLFTGIKTFRIPALVTQQYTKGLGPTTSAIRQALGDFTPIEKISFSALGQRGFAQTLQDMNRKNVILCGIESHVCVQQTALDLLELGYNVYVVEDCISSRKERDHLRACERMAQAGAILTTYEAVLFELLGSARADAFREISAIVK